MKIFLRKLNLSHAIGNANRRTERVIAVLGHPPYGGALIILKFYENKLA